MVWLCIYLDGVGRVGGGLETDQRAGILLVRAPDICDRSESCTYSKNRLESRTSCRLRDGSDINSVLRLGGSQLGNHGQEEKTETTHLVGFLLGRRGKKTFVKGSDR